MNEKPDQEVVEEKELNHKRVKKVKNRSKFSIFESMKPVIYLLAPFLLILLSLPLIFLFVVVYSYKKYGKEQRRPGIRTFKWFYDKSKYFFG